jgi:hypothetical protein
VGLSGALVADVQLARAACVLDDLSMHYRPWSTVGLTQQKLTIMSRRSQPNRLDQAQVARAWIHARYNLRQTQAMSACPPEGDHLPVHALPAFSTAVCIAVLQDTAPRGAFVTQVERAASAPALVHMPQLDATSCTILYATAVQDHNEWSTCHTVSTRAMHGGGVGNLCQSLPVAAEVATCMFLQDGTTVMSLLSLTSCFRNID